MIFFKPTPLAIPAHLLLTNLMLYLSEYACLVSVLTYALKVPEKPPFQCHLMIWIKICLPKCTLPMIFWVPTPLATPAHLLSTSLMMLHLSAHAWLIMVICAPVSGQNQEEWWIRFFFMLNLIVWEQEYRKLLINNTVHMANIGNIYVLNKVD